MNIPLILNMLGKVVRIVGLTMIPSLIIAVVSRGYDAWAFAVTIAIMLVSGTLASWLIRPRTKTMFARDGFFIVGLTWIVVAAFGALPAFLCGAIPSYVDSFFEAVSGFTTTGSSILTDVEAMPMGVLFWRSFTIWLGGMGVLVFALAVIPKIDARTLYLLKAESPGPFPDKVVPKLVDSARFLYIVYVVMTVIQIILLRVVGMPWFDSITHSFASAGTGGFSIKNASVGAYNNPPAEIIIGVFTILFGVNFTLYFYLLTRRFRDILKNEELRLYLGIIAVSVAAIAVNIAPIYKTIAQSLRYSFFQVSSIITTTGFATANFDLWPWFSKAIIVLLMVIGASAGSTGGGFKVIRVVLIFKIIKREVRRLIHPRMVSTVKLEGKNIGDDIATGVGVFLMVYFVIVCLATLMVSIDGYDLVTTLTAVLAAFNNVGPGLALVGPAGNFAMFSDFSKIVLSVCMLAGRLEIFPILIIFAGGYSAVRRGLGSLKRLGGSNG